MKKALAFFGSIAFFVLLASLTGGLRHVAFSVPALLMTGIASAICLGGTTKNVFDPLKWLAALHAMAFAILPMLLGPPALEAYQASKIHGAQWCLLIYLGLVILGYMVSQILLSSMARPGAGVQTVESERWGVTGLAGAIFLLGLFGYVYAVEKSGGVGYFIRFKGARPELFEQVHGLFYRLSLLMMSGYALFAAAKIRQRPIILGICAVALGAAYFLFMGRGLALSPIIIFTILFHYRVKRIKARYVVAGLAAGVLLVAITGALRSAGREREKLLQDPIGFLKAFATGAGDNVEHTLLSYVEHLDTFMLINEYLNEGGPLMKGRTLVAWFEPFDRHLFGNRIVTSVSAGHFVAVLRDPRFKDEPLGQWPTLAGEFNLNFGIAGAGFCMFCYGACIRMISRSLMVGSCSLVMMAIHPYVFYILVRATLSGSSHLTDVLIYTVPLLLTSVVLQGQSCRIEWMSQVPVMRGPRRASWGAG